MYYKTQRQAWRETLPQFCLLTSLLAISMVPAKAQVGYTFDSYVHPGLVYRGQSLYFNFVLNATGASQVTFTSVTIGGSTASVEPLYPYGGGWVDAQGRPVLTNGNIGILKINFPSNYPVGLTNVVVTTDGGGVVQNLTTQVNVLDTPAPIVPPNNLPTLPIPGLSKWESVYQNLASKWCPIGPVDFGTEQSIWYYDGARTYFQLADYTGNKSWETCAYAVARGYRDWVASLNYRPGGWQNFTRGLRLAYERSGDVSFKNAVIGLSKNAPFCDRAGLPAGDYMRETSYCLNSYVEAERVGEPRNGNMARSVDYLLGMFDGAFRTSAMHTTFIDGLAAEALINYYELTKDPRIPPTIKMMLDWTWQYAWDPNRNQLAYDSNTYTTEQINICVAAYAWYYMLTGDATYQQRGDTLFSHALDSDISYSPKIFNQNFKWSNSYIAWRTPSNSAPCSFGVSPLSPSVPYSASSVTFQITASSSQCAWSASSGSSWISVSPTSGTGSVSVTASIGANSATASRSGSITIAGVNVPVTQAAAPYTSTGTFQTIRVRAGGGSVTDSSGNVWSGDTGYLNGYTYATSSTVGNTRDSAVYQGTRYNVGTLSYAFNVPNGSYNVTLKFAEVWFRSAGQRVFGISLNGNAVASNFDIFQAAGGANLAVDRTFTVSVTNGKLQIDLLPAVENPSINAILIEAGTSSGGGFTPLRVNAGGGATTDSGGNSWTADTGFLSGFQYTTSLPIANTTDQALYRSSRWDYGTLSASYAVPNGTYTVVLKFAENYLNSAGQRIFNIRINGNIVQTNFDIAQQAGGAFRAVDMTYTVTTSTGKIDIDLIPVLSNPSINGIQISASSSTNTSTNTGMTLVRVNAGGGTTTDSGGNAWTADTGFLNGYQYTTWQSITNTTDQALYQSARWNAGTLSASYAVPNGTYAVVLKFAENYLNSAGQRIFNIRINGNIVQTNFDIAQQAGGAFRAVDMTYTVTTSTGKIDIDLIPVLSNPSINGIQISASSSATTSSFTPMRVNAGGGTTTDGAGNAWTADTGFLNGYQYTTWQSITNTTDQALYQSARWNAGTLSASYAVPNGTYAVVLKFAENYLNSAGQRIFNIRINGNIVQTNFDIAQQAGGAFRAVDMTYTVTTSTGKIDIDLIPVLSNPSINGIQISAQ